MAYKDSELVFIYLLSLLCTQSMQQYHIIVKCIRLQNSNMTQGSEYTYFYCGPMAGITRGCNKPPYAYCRTEESIKTLPRVSIIECRWLPCRKQVGFVYFTGVYYSVVRSVAQSNNMPSQRSLIADADEVNSQKDTNARPLN